MCFSWHPRAPAAINQGRHFHAPHFSWFLSEFTPFLSRSTSAPELPSCCTGWRQQQAWALGCLPVPSSLPPGSWEKSFHQPISFTRGAIGLVLGWLSESHHLDWSYLGFLSPPFPNNTLHTHSGANSNRKVLWPTTLFFILLYLFMWLGRNRFIADCRPSSWANPLPTHPVRCRL